MTALGAFASAASAERAYARPEAFTKLINCRAIADKDQRLACYDAAAGALEDAEKKKDLVVVDRKEIRETKNSLFGFALPKIGLFGDDGKDDEKDAISEIASTVDVARVIGNGNWSLRLAGDAGTWETISAITVAPRSGDKVRIKKASLGSYLGQVGMNRGVRFRRVQ
ncbi:hypothetical protein WP12_13640 [Sphingomonas sp. SRS2]|nr:hypothetical protein WP12_13640 [Sphingomonas sp. SRS2]